MIFPYSKPGCGPDGPVSVVLQLFVTNVKLRDPVLVVLALNSRVVHVPLLRPLQLLILLALRPA